MEGDDKNDDLHLTLDIVDGYGIKLVKDKLTH